MATVYEIKVKVVSPWVNYPPEKIEEIIKEALENHEDDDHPGNEFENVEVEAERIA